MKKPTNVLIAESVNGIIKQFFPDNYCSLCHAHAIVGSNVISVIMRRNYRPVAGMAVIDCGEGVFIRLTDNRAFSNELGGAYHCWIESMDDLPEQRELVDLTFRHNIIYAAKNNIQWRKKHTPDFLWGLRDKIVINTDLESLPPSFASGQIWLCETKEGVEWIMDHLADNMSAYVALTAATLRLLKERKPKLQITI